MEWHLNFSTQHHIFRQLRRTMRITRPRQTTIQRKSNRCRHPTWKVKEAGSWSQLLEDAGLSPRTAAAAQPLEVLRENASSPSDLAQGAAQPLKAAQETMSSPSDFTQGAAPADTIKIRKSFMNISANNPNGIAKGGAPTDPTTLSIMEGKTGLTLCFLTFQMKEDDAIEKKAFTLCHLNLTFAYWHFPNRLTPIDKSLQQSIKPAYKEGDWSVIKNILAGEFGRDIDGEQRVQFTMEFSELSYEYQLNIVGILEEKGYCVLDRDEWID
ncbi:unnamed protein product [Clonostachys rosea f. rosea IK726]|uniref:Uncharacterized protein n=1 Tax=Clonostachys rosea f. rosea IK726 TaxID=1349383 RepID=A0ACA9UK72_BIOOC|nr:unnamed protein product [Clonostachys rosea f. rosea IK726]